MVLEIRGLEFSKVSGRILTSESISDHNTFEDPEAVRPSEYKGLKSGEGGITLILPAKSVLVIEIL